jgi:SAM-dependent methyltransferase
LTSAVRDPGSYRDPSGFIFRRDGVLYRQVNRSFGGQWRAFLESGLYEELAARGLLIEHEPAAVDLAQTDDAEAVIRPREVRVVSYPYEWSFSQLRDAARLTLEIQERGLARGQTLRDATPFNVQFDGTAPIWIDSLSFAPLDVTSPWAAYRQFCEGFLAPLALMAYRDPRLGLLLWSQMDGIPLDMVSRLLPSRTKIRPGLAAHIHLHAAAQRRAPATSAAAGGPRPSMTLTRHRALVGHLKRAINSLGTPHQGSWADYTTRDSYSETAAQSKAAHVMDLLGKAGGQNVVDLGANDGTFSLVAAELGRRVVAIDSDWSAIDALYQRIRGTPTENVLPLVADIVNPSPPLGWGGNERRSLLDRISADTVMALALVHHLAIGRNVPVPMVLDLLARLGSKVLIEWIPKEDPMVQRLLAGRDDVFPEYTSRHFREAAAVRFRVINEIPINQSSRVLFLLERRQ